MAQMKASRVLVFGFCFMVLMIQKGYAREFQVNWGSDAENYNQWAQKNRFQIGDTLVFKYTPSEDSVLHVTEEAYKKCSVESPISKYTDGHTVISLSQSGPYYFIGGDKDDCEKNEKLVVVVMANRSNHSSNGNETNPPSPPPASSIDVVPSPAPSGESPAPSVESPPPSGDSPPEGTFEFNPTPAPSDDESKPPNAASAVFMSVTASIGAIFVASSLLLGL